MRGFSRPAAVARNGGDRGRGVAYGVSAQSPASDRILVVPGQQRPLDLVGLPRTRLGSHRPAGFPRHREYPRRKKERAGNVKKPEPRRDASTFSGFWVLGSGFYS